MKTININGSEYTIEELTVILEKAKQETPMDAVFKYDGLTSESFEKSYENIPEYLKAIQKEILIVSFYNKGIEPDWDDNSQYKYYPYFNMKAFSFYYYSAFYSCSLVPSRLCFLRKEDLLEAVEKFLPQYKESRLG